MEKSTTPVLREQLGGLIVGLLPLAIGVLIIRCATDVIPTPEENFGAPRWIVGLVGIVFAGAGVAVWGGVISGLRPSGWLPAVGRAVMAAGGASGRETRGENRGRAASARSPLSLHDRGPVR